MARQLVVLALVLFAIVGMASAAATTTAPVASNVAPAVSPSAASTIGAITGNAGANAAPIGGPVSASAFPNLASAPAPSAAYALQISTVAGVIATIVAGFFF